MKLHIKRLVCLSQFATAGQKQVFIMSANYTDKNGEFSLAYDFIEERVGRSRSSISEDYRMAVDVGLMERVPTKRKGLGNVPRFRWIVATLQKLANREAELKPCRLPKLDQHKQPRQVQGVPIYRRTWKLFDAIPDASGLNGRSNRRIRKLDDTMLVDPNSGSLSSENRTLLREDNNTITTSPRTAARESQQTRPHWGMWEVVQDLVRILEANPEEAHVAEFIHRVRKRLPPPPHFTADLFDEWVDALKVFPSDVLMRLADQQLRVRRQWVDSLQVLVGLAAQLVDPEPTNSEVHTDTRNLQHSPKVPNVREYPVADDVPPALQTLDRAVWDRLDWFTHSLFRQLRFEGVMERAAIFSGNGFAIDQLDKNHRATFENLVQRCIPNARHVDFRRDRICQPRAI